MSISYMVYPTNFQLIMMNIFRYIGFLHFHLKLKFIVLMFFHFWMIKTNSSLLFWYVKEAKAREEALDLRKLNMRS